MDRPPPNPAKLLEAWMEWEHGEVPPGRAMSNLKLGGLRDLLEQWAASPRPGDVVVVDGDESVRSTEAWTPVV
jgi:hypothetical protein